ncbi:MAG: PhzF family phenazine biosynthesis protein [Actinomycetota bacterium]|nr:PhzF family phenazine biosynthesis protein [Actinomycetota bacterium]
MIELRYRIVDVFTDTPLAGNALCVVLDPCAEPVMAAIAREVNLSETTFPVITGEGAYEMRIFTPRVELPFAGHPSLGTAWVLGPGRWEQTTEGGTVAVDADASGSVMTQPDPWFREVDPARAVSALGLAGAEGAHVAEAAGLRHVLVPTRAAIDRLAPDVSAVAGAAGALGAISLCPLRRIDDATLHLRVFAPLAGVAEDPGTGSAAGPAGVLARRLWGTAREVAVLQGLEMGRPSRMEVHAEEGSVRVGGRVAAVAEGRFTL